jgi:uncharacterized protein (DUF433 family)
MTFVETRYIYIVLDDNGVPRIAGTSMKVMELVLTKLADNLTPEELQEEYPYLSMGQIYSALAYYSDHKADLDAKTARELAWLEHHRQTTPPSPFADRLRKQGLV